jgi:hypothetical protein
VMKDFLVTAEKTGDHEDESEWTSG